MGHEKRIIDAFRTNAITKVLLIDDAYDLPEINENTAGILVGFLDSEDGCSTCVELGIKEETINSAAEAAMEGNTDSDELRVVYLTLYNEFARTGMPKFDPGDYFQNVKETNLALLRPLYTLLHKCGEQVEVRTAGLEDGMRCYHDFQPQLLFLDYYLDSDILPTGDISGHRMTKARKASLDLLGQVVKNAAEREEFPSVVLMSSRPIKYVDEYRHKAGNQQIMSLRFGFLKKDLIQQCHDGIDIEHAAADVLLDTSQGYRFGNVVQQALNQWKIGAQSALDGFLKEVSDLNTKDFAYLMRFRLQEEGQPLSEYLEWLFGECLKGLIDEKVNWKHPSFSKLDGKEKIEETIEGAFEGPSGRIARFFHRVRVNDRRAGTSRKYQLGDLYAQPQGQHIRAVITPDCDLVVRKGRTKVKSVLTMGGTLNTFAQEGSVADDFFFHGNTSYSVRWNPKDIETFPVKGKESLDQAGKFQFLGTLRPLYAQAMQRSALNDLSRIGLPVAPALGINATVAAWIRRKNASEPFTRIKIKSSALATIIPARAGQKNGHLVLLRRSFFNELIEQLNAVDKVQMEDADAQLLADVLQEGGTNTLYKGFLKTGALTNTKGKFGTGLTLGDKPDTKQDAPWLQITVEVSEDAMKELRTVDPLVVP